MEGQDGSDKMVFLGANIAENIDIVANGGRVLFTRNIASVTMNLDDIESIDFRALGGADNIVVGDLSGTDLTQAGLDLRGPDGGGDGASTASPLSPVPTAPTRVRTAGDAGGVNASAPGRGQRLLPGAGERPADAERARRRRRRQRVLARGR